jgi:hypothetical protein
MKIGEKEREREKGRRKGLKNKERRRVGGRGIGV